METNQVLQSSIGSCNVVCDVITACWCTTICLDSSVQAAIYALRQVTQTLQHVANSVLQLPSPLEYRTSPPCRYLTLAQQKPAATMVTRRHFDDN
eukprot:18888-Heterococcus_DN1.PRE.10